MPAVWERATKSIRCVECPVPAAEPAPPIIAEPQPFDPGTAGASARREYERRASARDERIRGKWGNRVGGVILALSDEPQSTRAWAIGAKGEEQLAKALEGVPGIRVLHDRRVPGTRGNIDHIVIGPAGVFVVDAKRYEGRIEIRDVGGLFNVDHRLYVGRRDCSKLADGLGWQVDAVRGALARAGIDPMPPITPVLCFIDGDWPIISPADTFRGVRLESPRSLRKRLAGAAIDQEEIARLARVLAAALPSK